MRKKIAVWFAALAFAGICTHAVAEVVPKSGTITMDTPMAQ
jgi:hypothetical protein